MARTTNLTDIATLTPKDLRFAMEVALASSTPVDSIADYVASVDWSNAPAADAAVRDRLGRLEQLSTLYAEGDIQMPEFRGFVRSTIHG